MSTRRQKIPAAIAKKKKKRKLRRSRRLQSKPSVSSPPPPPPRHYVQSIPVELVGKMLWMLQRDHDEILQAVRLKTLEIQRRLQAVEEGYEGRIDKMTDVVGIYLAGLGAHQAHCKGSQECPECHECMLCQNQMGHVYALWDGIQNGRCDACQEKHKLAGFD